jgi:hypothetical protein
MIALLAGLALFTGGMPLQETPDRLPLWRPGQAVKTDWLIQPPKAKAGVYRSADGKEIILDNGLIRRVFRLRPNAAAVAFDNAMTGEAMLRAVKPEAVLELDGAPYDIGGLTGQPDLAYLRPDWLDAMQGDPNAFPYTGFTTGKTTARFAWKRVRHSADLPWPPPGAALTLHFTPPPGRLPGVTVAAHYELYDGLPLLSKWLTIRNAGAKPVRLNRFTAEILGMVERDSIVDQADRWEYPNITVVTDYSFGGMSVVNSTQTVTWTDDPQYTTQVNYALKTPCVLEVRPPLGPDVDIPPGQSLDTFRVFELVHDSTDRERRGLAVRRMYRALAPWCTENPLMLHLTSTKPETVRTAIDQCAEVGFEMVIFSFGSGLNMEDTSPQNLARFKALADYAHSKGLQIGGYSLLASRRISQEDDVINPKTGRTGGAIFDNSPCLGSRWGIAYFEKLRTFLQATGFDLLEHDGSYPGDRCASTTHPGHRGLDDSQWTQYQRIADFYRWCRAQGIYLNVPDWYFLVGSNKTAMGYRETNWSLPRAQQQIHARQNLYDGTWEKTPTMGWMFVPLVEYQGGGAAATIEPLHAHLADYEQHLANNLGFGAQACYRGPRLYDTEETKALVRKWVAFFKQHRAILESDVIHLRRADARDLDGVLHVNPNLPEKGLAVFYNPTGETLSKAWELPLTYTGLTETAHIRERDGPERVVTLDRAYQAKVTVTVEPGSLTWFVIR